MHRFPRLHDALDYAAKAHEGQFKKGTEVPYLAHLGGAPHRSRRLLAFLAPDLQQIILDGRQPAALKLRTILKTELPLAWEDQRRWLAGLV